MGGWLRHRQGDVGVTARAMTQECTQIGGNGLSVPFWGICVHCCAVVDRRENAIVYTNRWKWPLRVVLGHLCTLLRCCGQPWGRRSVHKSPKMASPRRFGAFVYTVESRVAIRIATRAASGGTSASTTMACRRRLLAGPSRLVGKPGSERVAPLLGWHLRQDVNPHEPPKNLMNDTARHGFAKGCLSDTSS